MVSYASMDFQIMLVYTMYKSDGIHYVELILSRRFRLPLLFFQRTEINPSFGLVISLRSCFDVG